MNGRLQEYYNMVKFLATTLGPNYEIVLYDLQNGNGKIVAIENNHLTNRKIGDSLSPYMQKVIDEKKYEQEDFILNYSTKANSGRVLRSSTLFIKDQKKLIGILNLNFDDFLFVDIAEKLIRLVHPDQHLYRKQDTTNFELTDDIILTAPFDVIDGVIELFFLEREVAISQMDEKEREQLIENLDQDARLEIISELNNKGVFLIKGAVTEVAQKLLCSEPTIYRYLNKIK